MNFNQEIKAVLDYFNVDEIDSLGIRARTGKSWSYITDLVTKYRRVMKSKNSAKLAKITNEQKRQEFNEVKEDLINDIQNQLISKFSEIPEVVIFINRSSVNVFDPDTQTTAYVMLSWSSSCVNFISQHFSNGLIREAIDDSGYSLGKTEQALANRMKELDEVADCIYQVLTKLRKC